MFMNTIAVGPFEPVLFCVTGGTNVAYDRHDLRHSFALLLGLELAVKCLIVAHRVVCCPICLTHKHCGIMELMETKPTVTRADVGCG